ncbi:MAG: cytochrome c [Pseudomonadales bacterium]|nr:cytochrome c [Pseudomonadales bacterium]
MNKKHFSAAAILVILLGALYWVFALPDVGNPALPTSPGALARGEYLVNAGGCISCHQPEGAEGLSGGYEIESPFGGTFHVPNITPDAETGIAGWTGRDFLLAMKHGRKPGGGFYWPAFPYRSYQGMTDEDALAVGAWLMAQAAVRNQVPGHELPAWQFSWMMAGWNILADFMEGEPPAIPDDPAIARGAYLARHLGHCGECHTPRNVFGMMDLSREFDGSEIVGAEISPEGLKSWSAYDFETLLVLGMTAEGDFVGSEMQDVVDHNTSRLTPEDQAALAAFFTRKPAAE